MSGFQLYDWQKKDVEKLRNQRGALIANEMGTGKSYEGHELSREAKKTLWIAPMQTLESSYLKQEQMGIDRLVVICDPKNRTGSWNLFTRSQAGLYMVHWEALRLMPELVTEGKWDIIIADEVHRAQNRKAQQTRALKYIKADQKIGMSGTPVTGAPDKYWSVLNWLFPREFSSYWKYYNQYVDFEIVYPQGFHKITGPKNADELRTRIDPFYVRHLKSEKCCKDHPNGAMPWIEKKYYTKEYVDLLPVQRKAYNQMRDDMIAWVGAHENTPLVAPVIIAQMIRLQQFAVAYAETSLADTHIQLSEPSSKLDRLMQIIEDNPDEPIVVWSQFKQLIYLLEARCKKAGVSIVLYTGDNSTVRDQNVKRFGSGGAQVFAGTISSGGVGVDGLQYASSICVFLDRLWSPALNQQAEDRLHRDGQRGRVQVIDIVARNTVDRGRHQRLELVWSWIKELLG